MNREQLIMTIKKAFEVKLEGVQFLKKERIEQYEGLFGSNYLPLKYIVPYEGDDGSIEVNHATMFQNTIQKYFDDIFKYNPELIDIKGNIEIATIYTDKEATSIRDVKGKTTIFFENFSMLFLWMMNKAYLYRHNQNFEDNKRLHEQIFMHFATVMKPNKHKFVYPKPKTPPHKDEDLFFLLTMATRIQETFMVAHEIGHYLIKHVPTYTERLTSSSLLDFLSSDADQIFGDNEAIKEEVLADDIAFDLVMNVFNHKRDNKELVQVVSTYMFLFIRYIMWQRIVYLDKTDDYEFQLWFSRNSSMRRKINQAYGKWGTPLFIVNLFEDYLEDVLEPSALIAKEKLTKIINFLNCNNFDGTS
ncbi:hypothetical protein [Bacillus toyonensis]|uniref:hypothetical protein n=1 Tax=Bacillus toyonensis TaxID=155322 RepID=UPI000BFC3948|nr:hypothetical protein [Bacillus toyonensis]PHC13440.1 hypothetical protein COF03_26220 [Bacillus toyonensis]PHD96619.1 hypothetical protein COF43_22445 [Bacillus toyonensis]